MLLSCGPLWTNLTTKLSGNQLLTPEELPVVTKTILLLKDMTPNFVDEIYNKKTAIIVFTLQITLSLNLKMSHLLQASWQA
jgi:hypothetical protein